MNQRSGAAGAALLILLAAGCEGSGPAEPQPQPQPLTGSWTVTHVRGTAMPGAVLYVFDPAYLDGEEVSAHFVVDSSAIVIEANGEYRHRMRVTQWIGAAGGPPVTPTLRFFHGDFGVWTRTGTALEFESNWLQNHRMTGTYADDGILRMQHGFSHGDPPESFQYGRGTVASTVE